MAPARRGRRVRGLLLVGLTAPLMAACTRPLPSFDVVTPRGREISDLFTAALAVSLLVFLLVVGVLTYILVRFRERPGQDGEPPQVSGNRTLEITWTVVPAVILGIFFVLAVQTMRSVYADMSSAGGSALPIEVVGYRFWWEYRYRVDPSNPSSTVVTANELRVPVGVPLRLEITAADVLHDFWVPQFGWKRDAVPGKVNVLPATVTRAGTWDGICTNYCGVQHAWMRIRVVAEPQEQFQAWLQRQAQPAAQPSTDLERRGQQVFLGNTCVSCHTVAGTAAQGQVGPNLTHVGSRTIIGAGILENSQQNLRRFVENAQAVKPGVLMPPYVTLAAADLDALAAYLWSLK